MVLNRYSNRIIAIFLGFVLLFPSVPFAEEQKDIPVRTVSNDILEKKRDLKEKKQLLIEDYKKTKELIKDEMEHELAYAADKQERLAILREVRRKQAELKKAFNIELHAVNRKEDKLSPRPTHNKIQLFIGNSLKKDNGREIKRPKNRARRKDSRGKIKRPKNRQRRSRFRRAIKKPKNRARKNKIHCVKRPKNRQRRKCRKR